MFFFIRACLIAVDHRHSDRENYRRPGKMERSAKVAGILLRSAERKINFWKELCPNVASV